MNMDVNLHRLPEENKSEIEIYSASCSSYGVSGFGEGYRYYIAFPPEENRHHISRSPANILTRREL